MHLTTNSSYRFRNKNRGTGLAASIARLAGYSALAEGDGGDVDRLLCDRKRQEAETALQLLLKKAAQARRTTSPAAAPAAASEAAARLSFVLEDCPGMNAFSLGPIVKELRTNASGNADAAASSKSSGQSGLHPCLNSGAPAAKPNVAVAEEVSASRVLLDCVSLRLLPRLLADSLTPIEDDAIASDGPAPAVIPEAGGEILAASFAEAGESVSPLLPAANEGVFGALVRSLCGPAVKPARTAAAVRQIISHLDLFLDRRPLGAAAAAGAKEKRAGVSLFSTGIRLVAATCLGLLAVDGIDVPVGDEEVALERGAENASRVANESESLESVLQYDVDNGGSKAAVEQPSWRTRRRYAFEALVDVFRRPFLLRLACPTCFDSGSTVSAAAGGIRGGAVAKAETETALKMKTSTCGGSKLAHPFSPSLGEVSCTEISALLEAAEAAADTFEEAVMRREGGNERFKPGFVAEAAAPFLEGLCG